MFEQTRVARTGAKIHHRQLLGTRRVAFEQFFVMPLHDLKMAEQVLCKGRAAVIAQETGEAFHRLDTVGQGMGLLVRHHLEAMFDPAQEFIGRGQLVAGLESDPVAGGQYAQRLQCRPHPQFGMPATRDQLLGLREELDFADAAAADLDVVALHRDCALSAIGLHPPLHVMDVGKCGEIQMFAPDEGRDLRNQRLAGPGITGAGRRLDHGCALPGPPFPFVIMHRRFGRDRHLCRGRIRPQPQVDAKHVAVAGALLQEPGKRLRHAHEERLRFDVRRKRGRGGIEKNDQIDIAGIVQFARAHLAHREHDQTAFVLGTVEAWRRQPPARGLLPQQKAQCCLHRGDREFRQRRRHPHHRPHPADVAQRDQ